MAKRVQRRQHVAVEVEQRVVVPLIGGADLGGARVDRPATAEMILQGIQQKMPSPPKKNGVQTAGASIGNVIDRGAGVASIHQSTRVRGREPRHVKGNLKEQPNVSRIDTQ